LKATPNVVVERLTLLLRIIEAPGSNTSLDTCYPERFFVVLILPSRKIQG
jgi:hypothetical protein